MSNVIHRLLTLTYHYHLKWVLIMQRVHSLWVCFTPEGVIQNGSIFKSRAHISRHFYIGVAPPPLGGQYPLGGPSYVTGDRDTLGEYHQGNRCYSVRTDPYHTHEHNTRDMTWRFTTYNIHLDAFFLFV